MFHLLYFLFRYCNPTANAKIVQLTHRTLTALNAMIALARLVQMDILYPLMIMSAEIAPRSTLTVNSAMRPTVKDASTHTP